MTRSLKNQHGTLQQNTLRSKPNYLSLSQARQRLSTSEYKSVVGKKNATVTEITAAWMAVNVDEMRDQIAETIRKNLESKFVGVKVTQNPTDQNVLDVAYSIPTPLDYISISFTVDNLDEG